MKKLLTCALLALSSIAFGATTVPVQLLNPTGSSSGQAIVSTGASSAPGWGGIGVNGIAAIAGNTVLANATASSASPTAFAMPSCSTSASALNWTTSTGFTCNTAVNAAQLGGQTFTSPTITTPTINGVTSGVGAAAGVVGQFVCAQVSNGGSPAGCATNSNAPVSLTNAVNANVTSLSLAAGDWDVWGSVSTNPAGTTLTSYVFAWISTTSATTPLIPQAGGSTPNFAGATVSLGVPAQIINLSTTTTVYLSVQSGFNTSTSAAYGFLFARRRR